MLGIKKAARTLADARETLSDVAVIAIASLAVALIALAVVAIYHM